MWPDFHLREYVRILFHICKWFGALLIGVWAFFWLTSLVGFMAGELRWYDVLGGLMGIGMGAIFYIAARAGLKRI